jgi:hypothetical protein
MGLGLPRGSRSSRRSWGFARVRYDGLDRKSRRLYVPEPAGSERRQEHPFAGVAPDASLIIKTSLTNQLHFDE